MKNDIKTERRMFENVGDCGNGVKVLEVISFIESCREFGHKWLARYVASLVSNGKIVGTVWKGIGGYNVRCFPNQIKTGLSIQEVRDIMRDISNR